MREKTVGDLKLPKMSSPQHESRIFLLLWIMDINANPSENHYRVLFQDVNTGMYLIENIFPELLSYYTIGSYYRDSKLLKNKPPDGDIYDILIESTSNNRITEISDVISDKDYQLQHSFRKGDDIVDFTAEINNQYCVVFENNEKIEIFPCSVIGAAYYFTSSSMREQIFAQNLNGLYYKKVHIDPETETARIRIKPGAMYADSKHIIRFATNEFALKKWMAIQHDMLTEAALLSRQYSHVPLRVDFPVKQALNIRVRGVKIKHTDDKKDKTLVLDILQEDSAFGFKNVVIETGERWPSLSPVDRTVLRKTFETTDRIENKIPSSRTASLFIRQEIREKNVNAVNIETVLEYDGEKAGIERRFYRDDTGITDISLIKPHASGDRSIRHGQAGKTVNARADIKKDDPRDAASLNDFKNMLEHIRNDKDVADFTVHGPEIMPSKSKKGSNTLRETYKGSANNRRMFLYASFKYEAHHTAVIEIDQKDLPSGSSVYILVSGVGGIKREDVVSMLELYVKRLNMKVIREKMGENGLNFFRKKHPVKKEVRYYKGWCIDLLGKIKGL